MSILTTLAISTFSCKDKVICPAFQSTYILNDSIRMAKFSMFGTDSMPKFQVASRRNKHGVNKNYGLFERQRKAYDLMTSPKENVLGPPAKDPLFIIDNGEVIAVNLTSESNLNEEDSLQSESDNPAPEVLASAIIPENTGPRYKYRYNPKYPYNHEQEYYNKYYGELFIDNRPPPEKEEELELEIESDTLSIKKKKKMNSGFFKKKLKENEEEPKVEKEVVLDDPEVEEGGN